MRKVDKISQKLYFVKKIIMILIFSVVMAGINCIDIYAQSDVTKSKKGETLYSQAMELFVATTPDFDKSLKLLDESILYFMEMEGKQSGFYGLAKAAYLKGVIEKDRNHDDKAKENFFYSKELILKSLAIGGFSDGYRLRADVEGQLIFYGDIYYKTKFGPGIKNSIKKAIALDPGNKRAYVSLAMYYRDAPIIAGGSFKKSETTLKEMIDNTFSDQIDLFSLYLWIDTAWTNSKKNREKVSDCISVLHLFTNQREIVLMAQRIEKKYTDRTVRIIKNH